MLINEKDSWPIEPFIFWMLQSGLYSIECIFFIVVLIAYVYNLKSRFLISFVFLVPFKDCIIIILLAIYYSI
jgi:hypothetical protein